MASEGARVTLYLGFQGRSTDRTDRMVPPSWPTTRVATPGGRRATHGCLCVRRRRGIQPQTVEPQEAPRLV
eukprot:1406799-Prymnesium_polylepis.1